MFSREGFGLFAVLVAIISLLPGPVLAQSTSPRLPLVFLDTTYVPPTGSVINVAAGGNFQSALNAAQPGDVIQLQAGATFSGNFTLPNKSGTGWIYIQSSALASLPSEGTRVSPAQASLMPKIVSPNSASAIVTASAAHHYRFVGIEITTTWTSSSVTLFNLVTLEEPGGNSALSQVPTDIVFDRCYLHGTTAGYVRRGIALNSARTAIVDSYVSNFHDGNGDSQAIVGWSGPGPYKIVNNYLEGATENLEFGGQDPTIANLVPSDIEVRQNYLFKPLSWKPDDPSYAGRYWPVKNLFELKNAQRVLVDGNVMENNWLDAQNGFAVLFTIRNQDGTAPWSVVQDVTFTNNIVRHTGAGVNIMGFDDNFPSQQTSRILIKNNLFDDVTGGAWGGSSGRLFQLLDGTTNVVIDHNTAFQDGDFLGAFLLGGNRPHTGFVFRNNVALNNQLGLNGQGTAGNPLLTLTTYFPGATFTRNVVVGGTASLYPSTNFFPASLGNVGFVDLAGANYALAPASLYKGAGTDGKDIGADFGALNSATSCAISGVCGGVNPVPSAGSLSPTSVVAGSASFVLTVNGSNFESSSVIRWSGTDRTTTFVSGTQLQTTIPASLVAMGGSAPVTVANPPPGGGTSNSLTFTIGSSVSLAVVRAGTGSGTVTSAPSGINCGTSCSANYASGTPVTLTAAPAPGSTFTGWSGGGCSGTSTCTVTVAATTTVTATFTLKNFALTVSKAGTGSGTVTSAPAGINCGTGCAANYASGTPVTLTAAPAVGSTFAGWSGGGCSGTSTCAVTVTAATTVTATFTPSPPQFALTVIRQGSASGTVTSSPSGISCGASCTQPYASGTNVTLTASSGAGAAFKSWFGGCSGTGACVVAMTAVQSVTATFSAVYANPDPTAAVSPVRAVDIAELRAAVNTLRVQNFGLAAFTFTDPTVSGGATPVKAVHLTELRKALGDAYVQAGLAPPSYTDPTVAPGVTAIMARHLTELRNALRSLE